MKLIDGQDIIEHAEVNGESREFIRKLMDYIEDVDVVEPKTGDLISREALLKQIDIDSEGQPGWYGDTWQFIDTINNMSAVGAKWIPCSERLPEENVVVLTQAKFKDDIKMAVSARQDHNYWTGWGTREVNIVAWMPLPEPWEGADDE